MNMYCGLSFREFQFIVPTQRRCFRVDKNDIFRLKNSPLLACIIYMYIYIQKGLLLYAYFCFPLDVFVLCATPRGPSRLNLPVTGHHGGGGDFVEKCCRRYHSFRRTAIVHSHIIRLPSADFFTGSTHAHAIYIGTYTPYLLNTQRI